MVSRARIIDISGWQKIDDPGAWMVAARAAGFHGIYSKATEGNGNKSTAHSVRVAAARAAGLHAGAYHFGRPDATAGDPLREAALFADVAGPWLPGDARPALDLELVDGKVPAKALNQWALSFLLETERLQGRRPILYTGPSFWRQRLGTTADLAGYGLWQAEYHNEHRPTEPKHEQGPSRMDAWPRWLLWQWTGNGTVPFHRGPLDLSVFNGSVEQFDRWCVEADPT
jgi:lysozyme